MQITVRKSSVWHEKQKASIQVKIGVRFEAQVLYNFSLV